MTACCWAGCLPVLTQSRSPYPKHSTADIAAWNLPSITLMHAHAFNHSSFVLHKGARERSSDGRKSSKRFRIERSTDVLCWRITLVISLLCAVDNGRIDRDPFGVEPSWPRRAATGDNVNKQPIFIDQPRRVCWPTFIIIWQIVPYRRVKWLSFITSYERWPAALHRQTRHNIHSCDIVCHRSFLYKS